MGLSETLMADMQAAMRSGDTMRRDTLRMLRAALQNEEIAHRSSLSQEEEVRVLQREVRKREEALELFRKGGRQDLVTKTEAEIAIISSYLPEQLSEDEIREMARRAIEDVGAGSPREMGKVMQALMPQVRGKADGKVVNEIVRGLLSGGN